jgi:hypothetical protein
MITYREVEFGIRVPILHDVVLKTMTDAFWMTYNRDNDVIHEDMYQWCRKNCKGHFYFYPSWTKKIGAQFDDDEDAVLFALSWS